MYSRNMTANINLGTTSSMSDIFLPSVVLINRQLELSCVNDSSDPPIQLCHMFMIFTLAGTQVHD